MWDVTAHSNLQIKMYPITTHTAAPRWKKPTPISPSRRCTGTKVGGGGSSPTLFPAFWGSEGAQSNRRSQFLLKLECRSESNHHLLLWSLWKTMAIQCLAGAKHWPRHFDTLSHLILQQPYKVRGIIPGLMLNGLKFREAKSPGLRHTANQCQGWDVNLMTSWSKVPALSAHPEGAPHVHTP